MKTKNNMIKKFDQYTLENKYMIKESDDIELRDNQETPFNIIKGLNQPDKKSISINKDVEYWKRLGKVGKKCMIYTHDDLDGIMSAILMKEYLKKNGFEIVGYGVVNYTEGWSNIVMDNGLINISVDFAHDNPDLDIYIDHHGDFDDRISPKYNLNAVKTRTGSAYEGICLKLGIKTDANILYVIDMIDSARYRHYDVDIESTLDFDMSRFKNRLEFAAAFNQLIKRSDYRTIIEVIYNCNLSVLNIYNGFRLLYPMNNVDKKTEIGKGFVDDGKSRIESMIKRNLGIRGEDKEVFWRHRDFVRRFNLMGELKFSGFQLIGNLAFFPSGTWVNPIRARAILSKTKANERTNIIYMLLQYGNSLQVVGYESLDRVFAVASAYGDEVRDLDEYTSNVLREFFVKYGYTYKHTMSGGHRNIGNVSNIIGECNGVYNGIDCGGVKYVDMFKNKIISDLSGLTDWKMNTVWSKSVERDYKKPIENERVLMVDQLKKIW
jgi:hypothetical protein